MKITIDKKLFETSSKQSDMVDAFAYMVASQYAQLQDEYILLYIRKRPWYIPEKIYEFILKKVLVLTKFN